MTRAEGGAPLALRVRRAVLGGRWTKPAVFVLALMPLALLVWRAAAVDLGPNPEKVLLWQTGRWTLRMLLFTLAITPLRQLTGWSELARLRRMLGLFAFAYGLVHFTCDAWLVNGFSLASLVHDIGEHPFMLAGIAALLMMVPLALTSTNGMIRRLGAARWRALHRLVYAVAVVGVFHAWWGRLAKNDTTEPKMYAAVLAVLLAWRLARAWRTRRDAARAGPARTPIPRAGNGNAQYTSSCSPESTCSSVSRSRIRWARSPSTRTSAARGRVL